MFFSLSFLTLIILDTETAAYFLTVSFITLGNGIFNPPKRSLHFKSSLRLTEKILKVPALLGQQISTLENKLSQKNSHSSFETLHFKGKWVKSSVALLHKGQIAWSVSLSQGILQPMTSRKSDLISKFGKEIRKGRGNGRERMRREKPKD